MNQDNDKQEAMEVDPQVSAHYESLAEEKTPADLDRAILREAARALRTDNRKGSFGAWFRPVAFMATVGLSLVIILDLSDTSLFSPPADMSFEAVPPTPVQAPAQSAADATGKTRSQAKESKFMRQEKSETAQSLTADAPETTGDDAGVTPPQAKASKPSQVDQGRLLQVPADDAAAETQPIEELLEDHAAVSEAFATEVENAEQRVREMEAASGAYQKSQPATAAQFAGPQSAIAIESLSQAAPLACSDEQKADVEEWWKCIATLRLSGLTEAANLELENLRQIFPDFEPPQ